MKTFTIRNINDDIDQSLDDTLALMKRFEDTGMNIIMKDDYLALYDIYQRLQAQKQHSLQMRSEKRSDSTQRDEIAH